MKLLEHNTDINNKIPYTEDTILHIITRNKNQQIALNILLEMKKDLQQILNQKNNQDQVPLNLVKKKKKDKFKALLDQCQFKRM